MQTRTVFISMTHTLTSAHADRGLLVEMAEADTRFVFSCARRHVFAPDGTAPDELSWLTDQPHFDRVEVADLDTDLAEFWQQFRTVLADADAAGRIWWGATRFNELEEHSLSNELLGHDRAAAGIYELEIALVEAGHDVRSRHTAARTKHHHPA